MGQIEDFYEEQSEQGYYAIVRWQIDDVHDYRKNMEWLPWTDEQATEWLIEYEANIQDRMTEKGWDVFEFMLEEPEKENV
jgi:predicted dithiol-disulfide oxidoreductase (DUF899 family)